MDIEQQVKANLSRTDEFFVPSSLATMFWRPRFMADDPAMLHTPFLFWLVSAEAPRRLTVCGAPGGAAFFALCQALDKQNIMAQVQWFGGWKDSVNQNLLTEPPKLLSDHTHLLYDDLATLIASVDPSEAIGTVRPDSLDLLFVDLTDHSLIDQNDWLHCLKDTGLLLLHGTRRQQGKAQQDLESFLADKNKIEFQIGDGLTVVLKNKGRSARLESLLNVCSDGYIPSDIALFFSRLGQGVHAAAKEVEISTRLGETRASLVAAENKQSETEEELSSLRKLADERSHKISELQADQSLRFEELAELTRQLSKLREQKLALEQKHAEGHERNEPAQSMRPEEIEKLTVQLSKLQADKAALKQKNVEVQARSDAALSKRFEEIAELTRQLEVMRKSLEAKDAEISLLQEQHKTLLQKFETAQTVHEEVTHLRDENVALREHNEALLSSTSWRVTSPLRKLRGGV